jgi:hypothetical protein
MRPIGSLVSSLVARLRPRRWRLLPAFPPAPVERPGEAELDAVLTSALLVAWAFDERSASAVRERVPDLALAVACARRAVEVGEGEPAAAVVRAAERVEEAFRLRDPCGMAVALAELSPAVQAWGATLEAADADPDGELAAAVEAARSAGLPPAVLEARGG